jgi:hypothetical protein
VATARKIIKPFSNAVICPSLPHGIIRRSDRLTGIGGRNFRHPTRPYFQSLPRLTQKHLFVDRRDVPPCGTQNQVLSGLEREGFLDRP